MYKLTKNESIIRVSDGACIPADVTNADYKSYLDWVDGGNTPQEADSQVSPRITHVTMRQARLALLGAGKLPCKAHKAKQPVSNGNIAKKCKETEV